MLIDVDPLLRFELNDREEPMMRRHPDDLVSAYIPISIQDLMLYLAPGEVGEKDLPGIGKRYEFVGIFHQRMIFKLMSGYFSLKSFILSLYWGVSNPFTSWYSVWPSAKSTTKSAR